MFTKRKGVFSDAWCGLGWCVCVRVGQIITRKEKQEEREVTLISTIKWSQFETRGGAKKEK